MAFLSAIGLWAVLAVLAVLCGSLCISVKRRSNLPHGPRGYWFVGSLSDLLSEYQWLKFSSWSKVFGNVLYFTVLGRPVVVLNDFELARELLDKRSAMHSDRPQMTYIAKMLSVRSVTFMPYGDTWRLHRRLFQQYLNPRAVVDFRSLQIKCVRDLLEDLLEQPAGFWKHVKRFAASAVLSATYGYTVAREDDPLIKLNSQSEGATVRPGPPGASMVDLIPILRFVPSFMPGASFKRDAMKARPAFREMSSQPYEMVKAQRASGRASPSILSRMLDDYELNGRDDRALREAIKDACGSMYRAGVGTTSAVLYVFILAMVLHPQVARKAQKELDTVLRGERLPLFEDHDSLPYISCILKECLRWGPPFPLAIAHRAMNDSELQGRHIPKNSMIFPNVWQMMHDERNYAEPDKFVPDRFLDAAASILDPRSAVFGFGRRICPGRHFAEADIWLAMAQILTVFDILPAVDENGTEKFPKVEFTPGLSRPKEYTCRIVPRSESAACLIK